MKEERKTGPNRVCLIIGSHAHVPSGAPEKEFEYVYENKMLPFITNLYRYSNIHAVLHYSGVLLYWVERTHPEFFMLIEDMISRKQAEILGGGFYEPMFPLIPLQDRIGQIELMTTYLRKHFGKRPQGCWMPGMVWEQHLANALSASDMAYTFLSQDQFIKAGIKGAGLFSPCITEDQGKIVTIFPVSSPAEKELTEKSFSQVIIELHKKAEKIFKPALNCYSPEEKIVCVFPEKISASPDEAPDTAWNRFFEEISLCEDIVETTLPFRIFKSLKICNKASFPNSSGFENDFSPRRFLIDHDEANGIYSKMIFTNVLINQLKGDKPRKLNAREELWKAQDVCLFTPGNGQLRNELRKAAYSSLIRAECLSREKGKFVFSHIQYDFDFDGIKEYLFQDMLINCYIRQKGASIFELDYLPKDWNYLDCGSDEISRRRTSFADTLVYPDIKIDDLAAALNNRSTDENAKGMARYCIDEFYEGSAKDKKGKFCFRLSASGEDIPFGSIEINKCYLLKKNALTVSYMLKNTGNEARKFQFVPQIYFSFAGVGDEFVRFHTTDANGKDNPAEKMSNTANLKILDVKNEVQLLLTSSESFSGRLIPVMKNGLYQATCILPVFSLSLKPGESWSNDFVLKISH